MSYLRLQPNEIKANPMKRKLLFLMILTFWFTGISMPSSYANDFNCTLSNFKVDSPTPRWSYSMQKDLKILATWSIADPNSCIASLDTHSVYAGLNLNNFVYKYVYPRTELATEWQMFRQDGQVIITALFEISLDWLRANYNKKDNISFSSTEFDDIYGMKGLYGKNKNYVGSISAELSAAKVWAIWFSKLQGINTAQCDAPKSSSTYLYPNPPLEPKVSSKVVKHGQQPIVEFTFTQTKNCIFLLDTQPISLGQGDNFYSTPYWDRSAHVYFQKVATDESSVIQAATNMYVTDTSFFGKRTINSLGKVIPAKSTVRQDGENIVVTSQLDLMNAVELYSKVGFYLNYYYWYHGGSSSSSAGWTITWNSNSSFTARYNKGSYTDPGFALAHNGIFFELSGGDLILSPEARAEAQKLAEEKSVLNQKKSKIVCVKGKLTKTISGENAKCPKGYKVKK